TGVQIRYENGELVAAKPRDDVGGPEGAIEYCGGTDQCVVAFGVSKLIVDPLHSIEVDEEQQQFFLLPSCEIEVRRSLFQQATTIEETREIVFQRTVAECF